MRYRKSCVIASGTVAPWRVSANLMDHPRECYGTHDAGSMQGFHRPRLHGTVPERTLHACFLVECPKRGDEQDWDGSHLLELLPKCDILIAARDCQGSWPRHPAHDARTRG